jgi:hypothetical protein
MIRRGEFQPSPSELGINVTIAIVAVTAQEDFVCVTDRAISYGDVNPTTDNAVVKNIKISANWSFAYSASDIKHVLPILEDVRYVLKDKINATALLADDINTTFSDVYARRAGREFIDSRLRKLGYKSIEEFRHEGRSDLGDNYYFELMKELSDESLSETTFIVYGYDEHGVYNLFEVSPPGRISDKRILRYAVIGSGFYMANSSLRMRPLDFGAGQLIYRLLAAKFSAETALGVGKSTTLSLKSRGKNDWFLGPQVIEDIRGVWEKEIKKPEPQEAMEILLPSLKSFAARGDAGE